MSVAKYGYSEGEWEAKRRQAAAEAAEYERTNETMRMVTSGMGLWVGLIALGALVAAFSQDPTGGLGLMSVGVIGWAIAS